MNLWHSFILGVIEGLTEFLPISSTGHLILTTKLLGLAQTDFMKSFQIAIQLGAILAVVVLYFKTISKFNVLLKVCVAFLPTVVFGVLLYKIVKNFLLNSYILVLVALFLGGIFLIIFELYYSKSKKPKKIQISFADALIIGLIQTIAFIPGVSRSLATILGGLILGIDREKTVEFSFLLAVPTIFGATVFDMLNVYNKFNFIETKSLLVGFSVAFFVALVVIKFFIQYIQKNNFILFGVYRILIAVILYLVIF